MRNRVLMLLLAAGLLAGVAVRVFHLDHQTLTHPEFYTPGIRLPEWVRTPAERLSVEPVLAEALLHDKHPPGYYVLTLAWNRMFGTDLFAMRLSSVLFGILAVLAMPWYLRATGGGKRGARTLGTAVLAVWLLSLHGFHVSWSQQLRPWALVGTLGLVTTGLAASLVRRPGLTLALAYAALAALGLWADYYFWPIFALQVLWLVLQDAERKRMTPALNAILLAGVLAAPLLLYFFFHMTGQESHIGSATWRHLVAMMQFGAVIHRPRAAELLSGLAPAFSLGTAALGLGAILLGLGKREAPEANADDGPGPFSQRRFDLILVSAALLVPVGTWVGFHDVAGDRKIFTLALAAPFFVLGLSALARVAWPPLARAVSGSGLFRWARGVASDPSVFIPLGAFAGLVIMSQVVPVFAPYGLVVYTPFIVAIAARGLMRMGRFRAPAIAAALGIFAFSVFQFGTAPISAREYQGLARQMIPLMGEGDAVLLANAWYSTPMNYYLPPDRYRVLPAPATDAERTALPDTVWAVGFGENPAEIEDRLLEIVREVPGFVEVERVSTPTSAAARMVRRAPG